MILGTAGKAIGGAAAAAAGAAVASAAPRDPGMWSILVLGIPLAVLAASLAGAAMRHLREPSQPDTKIPAKVVATVADGFIGGWLAMLLIGLPITHGHIGTLIRPEVVGAICALLVQFLRDHAKGYFDRIFDTVLGWFARKRAGGDA